MYNKDTGQFAKEPTILTANVLLPKPLSAITDQSVTSSIK